MSKCRVNDELSHFGRAAVVDETILTFVGNSTNEKHLFVNRGMYCCKHRGNLQKRRTRRLIVATTALATADAGGVMMARATRAEKGGSRVGWWTPD